MLIYCDKITPRISYAFKVIFECVCKTDYKITNDFELFSVQTGPKINYSNTPFEGSTQIIPSEIMFSQEIRPLEISNGKYNDHIVLFLNDQTDFPYDPIAAVFYMVSRYEEYLPFKADKHDRFPIESNLSYQLGFHTFPVVHYWVDDLVSYVQKKYPDFTVKENKYGFLPTFDIDNAYAYINKDPIRTYGALIKSLFTNFNQLKFRLDVLKRKGKDPYDTYDYINKVNDQYKLNSIFFILTSSQGNYDKNINPNSTAFKKLISLLSQNNEIGIHPSYASNRDHEKFENEIKLLGENLNDKISKSRQHYLKLRLPDTYELLTQNEISNDYSMGFAECAGFRAGITVSFPFYNLKVEKSTDLTIFPFAFMESSYMYYGNGNIEEAKSQLLSVLNEVKKVKGNFITIWHNESLGNLEKWKGWKSLFEYMYKEAAS